MTTLSIVRAHLSPRAWITFVVRLDLYLFLYICLVSARGHLRIHHRIFQDMQGIGRRCTKCTLFVKSFNVNIYS